MAQNSDQIRIGINDILKRTVEERWKEKIAEFLAGKIGKLMFLTFITQEFKRMEDELVLQVELWLKQHEVAEIKPVWEDNLRTKALLEVLLETVKDSSINGQNNLAAQSTKVKEKSLAAGDN